MIVMLTPSPPEQLICCLCERPAGRVMTFVPLCLRCRTAGYERVAAAELKPVTVLSNPTGPDLLIQKGQVLIASGSPGPPLEAA
jgi:hypothetical protein